MQLARYRTDEGCYLVVTGSRGTKWLNIVVLGIPVIARQVHLEEEKYMTPIEHPALKAACKRFLKFGKQNGITKTAKKILKEGLT
jgi:hypothetical protein